MTTRLIELPQGGQFRFNGGLASAKPNTNLDTNQALDLSNVYITPAAGIAKRQGNTVFNSTAMNSGADVIGLGYYKLQAGTEYLMAIAGNKIFKSDNLDGTMDDITGGLTITAGQNNIWTHSVMNDLSIFVGGAPDAPIKWTATGNAALLGGTPPQGQFGFQINNRFFIGAPDSDRSTIYWSALADPEDWSGTGSGSSDVYTGDGDTLVGYAILNTDIVLLFKQNSIHQMVVREAPFPVFSLAENIGAISKNGIVVAKGMVYFITPKGRMAVTDGTKFMTEVSLPRLNDVDDLWKSVNSSRLQFIQGIYYEGDDFEHIIWLVSTGTNTENDLAIVWDIRNACWLKHTTGYKANVMMVTQGRALYGGFYDGKVYRLDSPEAYTDASETSPGPIDGYWESGWLTAGSLQESIRPFRLNLTLLSQNVGDLTLGYGFDFSSNTRTETISMEPGGSEWGDFIWGVGEWGGQADIMRNIFLRGRGNAFQVSFRNQVSDQDFLIHGWSVSGVPAGQKIFGTV